MLTTLILFTLLHLLPQKNEDFIKIYVAKIDWHVGIILPVIEKTQKKISALKDFNEYKFVDIGWGDSEFYQGPDEFDAYLASKAILVPTNSVLRIQGYNYSILRIADWRDYAFEIELTPSELDKLCQFIDDSFKFDSNRELILSSERFEGAVKFYSSIHKYHLFNTCNTWVAEGLERSGLRIDHGNVITADQLFSELLGKARLMKYDKDEQQ